MRETVDDLVRLQALLDRSHEGAGEHLRSIFTDERRVPATELVELLDGMNVLNLATVTAKGEPRVAPVDGHFIRGSWVFGSSPTSARARHLARRPAVSASHTRGEELAVLTHGRAVRVDLASDPDVRDHLVSFYGDAWFQHGFDDAPYWRIEADRMFTFRFSHQPS